MVVRFWVLEVRIRGSGLGGCLGSGMRYASARALRSGVFGEGRQGCFRSISGLLGSRSAQRDSDSRRDVLSRATPACIAQRMRGRRLVRR